VNNTYAIKSVTSYLNGRGCGVVSALALCAVGMMTKPEKVAHHGCSAPNARLLSPYLINKFLDFYEPAQALNSAKAKVTEKDQKDPKAEQQMAATAA